MHFKKQIQIAKLIKDHYLYFHLKLAQARLKINCGQFHQAEIFLRSAFQMAKQDGSQNELNKYHLENGLLQLIQKKYSRSVNELSTAAKILYRREPSR